MISVVIPSYNRRDCIVRLLQDLAAQESADFEVIIVDDCSPDDTVEIVRRDFPHIRLFVNESNGGPSVTRNRGIKEAKGDIVVGLDSDVSVNDTHLLEKVQASFDGNSGSVGFAFRIYCPDTVTDDSARWWHPRSIASACGETFETDYFSGTAYAFRREAMVKAGLYPEIVYMHYEEVELAFRILDQGGVILYRPDFSVVHHANPVTRPDEISVFYKPRNQILLAASCLPAGKAFRFLAPRVTYQFFKACRWGHLDGFIRAMRSAVQLTPVVLDRREPLKRETLKRIAALKSESKFQASLRGR